MKNTVDLSRRRFFSNMRRSLRFSGLRAHMTISYVWVTVTSVLLLEILVMITLAFFAYSSLVTPILEPRVKQDAVLYALQASSEAQDNLLNPQSTFLPHRADSLISPQNSPEHLHIPPINYISVRYSDARPVPFALLIAPNGQIVASSYPQRYPPHTSVWKLLSTRTAGVAGALAGSIESGTSQANSGSVVYAAAPVLGKDEKAIGAVYVEVPGTPPFLPSLTITDIWLTLKIPLNSSLVLFFITAPIGGLFGAITTRGLIRRIHRLATATTKFADGNYAQKVPVSGNDEVGLLEAQFNRMAEQLQENIARQQELAEQNARLAERSRISRELHDALSQDLFSLHMLAGGLQAAVPTDSPLYPPVTTLKRSTQTVLHEMRALLLELRPTQLEQLGLPAALEDLAAAYRARLGIEVTTRIQTVSLPSHIEHAILRIVQEALSNSARHADATVVTLALQPQEETITLTITDNGQGFEPGLGEKGQHGMGLFTMQERVQELHGTFELKTAPGQGTHIHICLPREEEHDSHSHH
jgi:NarL family two-component system sensor histidine kinase LiaS